MGDESLPFFMDQGTTKTFQIPIGHLDYKFIEKCTDVKHLEKILRILRSGEEGCYPELTLFCEKRIEHLDPRSRALRKEKSAATASDFTAEEWETITGELMSWISEHSLKLSFPLVYNRNTVSLSISRGVLLCSIIKSVIFINLRFDVEKECSKIDESCEESNSKARFFSRPSLPIIKKKIDTTGMTKKEKIFIATREKEKGNEAFASGDYVEAVTYYTRSISVIPTAAAYNNKAQAEIKLQDWDSALQDCEKVLDMEPGNIKGKGEHKLALLCVILFLANKIVHVYSWGSKAEDRETQKQKESTESGLRKGTSEKNTQKQLSGCEDEVNGYLHSDQKSESPEAEVVSGSLEAGSQSAGGGNPISLPPAAAKLKSEGNELFKSGQFGEAVFKYSEAIEYVAGLEQSPDDLSILYSNRAACYLKEGNCSDCIQDCNRALELQPFSLKPLLRRAMANECMERYRQAYIDYKTVLQIDSSIQAANDSANRITKALIDQDGPSWREKLPPIPVVPVAAQLHRWDGGNLTSENMPRSPIETEEQFKTLKTEGNGFVKEGKYEEAVNKYNECMKLNSKECAIYTNRALCYLKLCKYEEAKQDCDHVLQIEDSNIKAFYRRALAYKGLQNYQASIDDLNRVLLIDPNVLEAKKELEEVTHLLDVDSSAAAGSQEKQRKKITIQEVTGSDEEEERPFATSDVTDGITSKEAVQEGVSLKTSEKLSISEPTSAYDFGQIINAVNSNKDKAACADLLTITDPKKLPVLLSNKLEGEIFLVFIQSLKYYIVGKDPGLVYQHLFYLSKAERFKVVLALLSKKEKEQVQQLFSLLPENQSNQYSSEDLESLKKLYEL
uniref:Sperm-associated antigen 1 n=2 Tax=Amazona TaxID=12929 RepID=A0A8B9IXE6_9PSIT